jgi:hypothetical protein
MFNCVSGPYPVLLKLLALTLPANQNQTMKSSIWNFDWSDLGGSGFYGFELRILDIQIDNRMLGNEKSPNTGDSEIKNQTCNKTFAAYLNYLRMLYDKFFYVAPYLDV